MSDQESREHRSRRLHDDETKIKKRQRILKDKYFVDTFKHPANRQPHRLSKMNGVNCGNPGCFMCSNPRKTLHEPTIQEQKFYQEKLWSED